MSGTVSREKYSTIKRKGKQWRAKALEAMNEVEELQLEVERLEELLEKNTHNPELVKQWRAKSLEALNEVGELQLEVERLEELQKNTHNPELVKQLRTENKEIKLETEKVLYRQNKKIIQLQKDLEDLHEALQRCLSGVSSTGMDGTQTKGIAYFRITIDFIQCV